MADKVLSSFIQRVKLFKFSYYNNKIFKRTVIVKESGALYTEPKQVPLGLIRVIFTVIPGLLIGATISKTIANFLEENDLFVPSDDDDDD
ncbi:conserved hypothetical protein [Pediculus humanus corporis]|uniref:Essential MCU regulator, mitochondrial n=1 Tax=Pediculus humanus subsp. corporis TaxID=121224 RepID=E0VPA6_PEDHC|nr:uncharacterized protein Phum_PHUM355130 [Pediculus humanus corporis]EEB15212.1 conserved hypothetical protein [Pediculus humanus corporis]